VSAINAGRLERVQVRAHAAPRGRRFPGGPLLVHALLIASIAVVAFPLYFAFVVSTQSLSEVVQKPPRLLPSTHFVENYAEAWRRWIYDDYYRSYLVPLEKYGLTIPHDLVEESWNRIWNKGYVHEVAQFFATGWLANYWRIDGMTDEDFEWFEHKYPGWYDKYGKWWERYSDYSVKNGHKPIAFEPGAEYEYPHRCWTCMVPALIREDIVVDEVETSEAIHAAAHPGRHTADEDDAADAAPAGEEAAQ